MTRRSVRPRVDLQGSETPPGIRSRVLRPLVRSILAASPPDPGSAVEMPDPWTSQNDVHRPLEISYSTRDSHIPTAGPVVQRKIERTSD